MIYIIILCIIVILVLSYLLYKLHNKLLKIEDNQIDLLSKKAQNILEKIEKEKQEKENERKEVAQQLEEQKQRAQELQEQMDKRVEMQFQVEREKLNSRLTAETNVIKEQLTNEIHQYELEKEAAQAEAVQVQQQLTEYKKQQQAINEEILRRRQVQEQQDFYRIVLMPESHEDIQVIQSIREKLHKREFLDKMVYDNYIAKAVKEMSKRVLSGKDPSGIYKITNIETQEIYIGKSVNVATRWVNHIKSACGLEGVADSQFQRALKKYGIENWTFELLEEVPKDKLTEREKFYIQMYDTTKYGYNQRVG